MGLVLLGKARQFAITTLHSTQLCNPRAFSCSRIPFTALFARRTLTTNTALRASVKLDPSIAEAMAAASLPNAVQQLSLHSTSETSKYPNCFPSLNPVDIYREHIAEKLSAGTGIEAEKIYPRLAWTSTLDKGDLVLPVCSPFIWG